MDDRPSKDPGIPESAREAAERRREQAELYRRQSEGGVGKSLKRFAAGTRGSVIRTKGPAGSRSAFGMPKKAVAS